ncbi:unnamed protein product [Phaedon cochleariae]|uniref:Aminopeptidase n=1 Tax=Phaedon cochleariae TaxID=80249 RepID=A0A9N9SF46_PHACE|nr:unnamed protein product [Phaedon cochleariae]
MKMNDLVILSLFFSVSIFAHESTFRLSKEAIPVHYSLTIRPEFDEEVFHGEVLIYLRTTDNLQNITLHSSQLNITELYINQRNASFEHGPDEKLVIKYEEEDIQPGEHTLFIKYSGKLVEDNVGFIKAPYEYNGKQGYIFVTDLEPIVARKVFPCFDEPSFKAKFNVRLISPNDTYKAISNMPEIKKFSTPAGVVYDFATSVKMSTYLLSFAFTEYPYHEGILEDHGRNVSIRIYTYNATKENNDFAVECTKKAIQFYSDYTDIAYPLPKLDMIEYKRLETAATENWGLITFREGLLTPSLHIYSKSQIRLVVYHELSHFWFGNMVTNDWWNDLWLQEGFATYMSYKLLAKDFNTIQVSEMKDFQNDEYFETEIYKSSLPIVSHVSRQSDISKKFHSVVYEKGAGLLLMLEDVIGEDKFRLAIQTYLKRHAFGTATTNDFIAAVEETVPDVPLRSFLESFLYQNKFPIISVNRTADRTYILSQKVCEVVAEDKPWGQRWTIPVTYITDQNSSPKLVWLDRDMIRLEIDEKDAKWIILNPQGKGMYKAVLSTDMWKEIAAVFGDMDQQLADTVISDAYYSFRFNMLSCDVIIDLMKKIQKPYITKWTLLFPFYEYLTESLVCGNHMEASEMFWKFIRKRFVESGYKKRPKLKRASRCDEVDILKDHDLSNIKQCAKWIEEHLQNFSNVIVNELVSN